jgi:hypothetical protein
MNTIRKNNNSEIITYDEEDNFNIDIEYFENWYLDDVYHFFHEVKEYCGYHPTIFEYLRIETFQLFVIQVLFEGIRTGKSISNKKFYSFINENYENLNYLYTKFSNFFNYFVKKYKLKGISFDFNDFLTFCGKHSNVKNN